MSDIKRLNTYNDPRFTRSVLDQHGAFLVDGRPVGFEITGQDTAVVYGQPGAGLEEVIAAFRFYTFHITRFTDPQGNALMTFPSVNTFPVAVADVQPSQFFVDESKLEAVARVIRRAEDIVIPLLKRDGLLVALDGHTRLALAGDRGYGTVQGYFSPDADEEDTMAFVCEAQKRGVHCPAQLKRLSHAAYQQQWIAFCDAFFRQKASLTETGEDTGCIL